MEQFTESQLASECRNKHCEVGFSNDLQNKCSALVVRIFFINPRPACRETEKDGEGERDTGITSRKGVTRHVARGYLRTYSLDRWRGAGESSPPPPYNPTPFGQFEAAAADLKDSL
jgi:hypothetical protein